MGSGYNKHLGHGPSPFHYTEEERRRKATLAAALIEAGFVEEVKGLVYRFGPMKVSIGSLRPLIDFDDEVDFEDVVSSASALSTAILAAASKEL